MLDTPSPPPRERFLALLTEAQKAAGDGRFDEANRLLAQARKMAGNNQSWQTLVEQATEMVVEFQEMEEAEESEPSMASEPEGAKLAEQAEASGLQSKTSSQSKYQPGQSIDDRFEIVELLGTGRYSEVYRARDHLLQHECVLKILKDDDPGANLAELVRRECNLLDELRHPHIARHIGEGQFKNLDHFIMLEYLPGRTLSALLREAGDKHRKPPLPLPLVRRAAHDLLATLIHIQDSIDEPYAHRDIKPGNLLWTDSHGLILIDFNVSKKLFEAHTTNVGTPSYMPPEVSLSGKWTKAADVFSAGIVFYELLTGRHPFGVAKPDGESASPEPSSGAMQIDIGPSPPDPRAFNPDVDESVARILLKAIALNDRDRYQSAREMKEALDSAWPMTDIPETPLPPAAAAHIAKANEFLADGDYGLALDRLQQARRLVDPGTPEAKYLDDLGRSFEARRTTRRAELEKQVNDQLAAPDAAFHPPTALDALDELKKITPGDLQLALFERKIKGRAERLRRQRIYSQAKEELEELWQAAEELDSTAVPHDVVDREGYTKALNYAREKAQAYPDIVILQELVVLAEQKREEFLDRRRTASTLMVLKEFDQLLRGISLRDPELPVEVFDLEGNSLGKFPPDEAIRRIEAMASDFAAAKYGAYSGQVDDALTGHNPGAAKAILEKALELYGLNENERARIRRRLDHEVGPLIDKRRVATERLQQAEDESDPLAAWQKWKEARREDEHVPRLEEIRAKTLNRLLAELTRRLNPIRILLDSSEPSDWERAKQEALALVGLTNDDPEALAGPRQVAQALADRADKYAVGNRSLSAFEAKLRPEIDSKPEGAQKELKNYWQKLDPDIAAKFAVRLQALTDKIAERLDVQKLIARLESAVRLSDLAAVEQAIADCEQAKTTHPQLIGRLNEIGGALKLHRDYLSASQAFYGGNLSKELLIPVAAAAGHPDQQTADELIAKIDKIKEQEPAIASELERADSLINESRREVKQNIFTGKAHEALEKLTARIERLEKEKTSTAHREKIYALRDDAQEAWHGELIAELHYRLTEERLRVARVKELVAKLKEVKEQATADLRARAEARLAAREAAAAESRQDWGTAKTEWEKAETLDPSEEEYHRHYERALLEADFQDAEGEETSYDVGAQIVYDLSKQFGGDPEFRWREANYHLKAARIEGLAANLVRQRLARALEAAKAGHADRARHDRDAARMQGRLNSIEAEIRAELEILREREDIEAKTARQRTVDDFVTAAEMATALIARYPDRMSLQEWWHDFKKKRREELWNEAEGLASEQRWARLEPLGKMFALDPSDGRARSAIVSIGPDVSALAADLRRRAADMLGGEYSHLREEESPFAAQLDDLRVEERHGKSAMRVLNRFGDRIDHSDTHRQELGRAQAEAQAHVTRLEKAVGAYQTAREAEGGLKRAGESAQFDHALAQLDNLQFDRHIGRQRLKDSKDRILAQWNALDHLRLRLQMAATTEEFRAALAVADEMESLDRNDEYGRQAAVVVKDPFTGQEIKTLRSLKPMLKAKQEQLDRLEKWRGSAEPAYDWPEADEEAKEGMELADWAEAANRRWREAVERRDWPEAQLRCRAALERPRLGEGETLPISPEARREFYECVRILELLGERQTLPEAIHILAAPPEADKEPLSNKAKNLLAEAAARRKALEGHSKLALARQAEIKSKEEDYETVRFPRFKNEWAALAGMMKTRRNRFLSERFRKDELSAQRTRVRQAIEACRQVCPRDPLLFGEDSNYVNHPWLNPDAK